MHAVLSYHDSKLYSCDVQTLDGPHWLNDRVIGFYFEFLTREAFTQPGLLLVSGSETYLLANLGPGGAAIVLEPRGFAAAELALFAVNNNPDVQRADGGSHWSLLACCPFTNTFHHYDSLHGSNRAAARRVFEAARRPGSQLREQVAPQQQNGHDCGVCVLALARLLCRRHHERGPLLSFEVGPDDVTPADVAALRRDVLQLVRQKAAAAAGG